MRNLFYLLAAILAFGVGWFYYQDVETKTATITKLRLVAEDGLIIEAGTVVDEAFLEKYVVSQAMPRTLAGEFGWALNDDPVTMINLRGQVFGQDVPSGSFLQRAHFFLATKDAFARRIHPGNRAFSIPIEQDRAVENFITPGSHIDILAPIVDPATELVRTIRVLENAEVMAVGAFDNSGDLREENNPEYDSVTLQAPSDAVEAFLALEVQAVEDLTLVLRNPCEGALTCERLSQ